MLRDCAEEAGHLADALDAGPAEAEGPGAGRTTWQLVSSALKARDSYSSLPTDGLVTQCQPRLSRRPQLKVVAPLLGVTALVAYALVVLPGQIRQPATFIPLSSGHPNELILVHLGNKTGINQSSSSTDAAPGEAVPAETDPSGTHSGGTEANSSTGATADEAQPSGNRIGGSEAKKDAMNTSSTPAPAASEPRGPDKTTSEGAGTSSAPATPSTAAPPGARTVGGKGGAASPTGAPVTSKPDGHRTLGLKTRMDTGTSSTPLTPAMTKSLGGQATSTAAAPTAAKADAHHTGGTKDSDGRGAAPTSFMVKLSGHRSFGESTSKNTEATPAVPPASHTGGQTASQHGGATPSTTVPTTAAPPASSAGGTAASKDDGVTPSTAAPHAADPHSERSGGTDLDSHTGGEANGRIKDTTLTTTMHTATVPTASITINTTITTTTNTYTTTTSTTTTSTTLEPCHTAVKGESCFHEVDWALHQGIIEHPEWYPGLTRASTFADFQASLWLTKRKDCPRPCGVHIPTTTLEPCHTAVVGEACWDGVAWAMQEGLAAHPEWYPGLNINSTFEAIQESLWKKKQKACRRPCDTHTLLPTTTVSPWPHPSFFCYSVARLGYEMDIMKTQLERDAGIFACDEQAVLSEASVAVGHGVHTILIPPAAVGVSRDGTAANVMTFVNAWNAVHNDGRYKAHDFVVKADPDSVLVPERLRRHVAPHAGLNVFFTNCDMRVKWPQSPDYPMMYGALEVLSTKALDTYIKGQVKCMQTLPWQAWGEDLYMTHCLNMLGTIQVGDFNLVSDGRCWGVDCNNAGAAAFHDFKTISTWLECWATAMAK